MRLYASDSYGSSSSGSLSLRGQHPRRELGCQCEHALQEACLTRRWPVQPAVAVGPRLERREGGRRQAGREVDREAAVLEPAEPAEEEDGAVRPHEDEIQSRKCAGELGGVDVHCEVVDVLDIALVRTFAIFRHLRWARRPREALLSRRH